MEIKPIKGYEQKYSIDEFGEIISHSREILRFDTRKKVTTNSVSYTHLTLPTSDLV